MGRKKKRLRETAHPSSATGATYVCPWCLDAAQTWPDPGAGEHQTYVEDCPLCCHPNVLDTTFDRRSGEWAAAALRES
jgi:cysteine-rich CPXCG protein